MSHYRPSEFKPTAERSRRRVAIEAVRVWLRPMPVTVRTGANDNQIVIAGPAESRSDARRSMGRIETALHHFSPAPGLSLTYTYGEPTPRDFTMKYEVR